MYFTGFKKHLNRKPWFSPSFPVNFPLNQSSEYCCGSLIRENMESMAGHMSDSGRTALFNVSRTRKRYIYIYTGWWFQPLWKILVSWGYYSRYWENKKNVPNHQPVYKWSRKLMAETPDMAIWRLQFRNDSLILSGTLKYMRKRQNMSNDTLQKVYNFSWLVGLLMP